MTLGSTPSALAASCTPFQAESLKLLSPSLAMSVTIPIFSAVPPAAGAAVAASAGAAVGAAAGAAVGAAAGAAVGVVVAAPPQAASTGMSSASRSNIA